MNSKLFRILPTVAALGAAAPPVPAAQDQQPPAFEAVDKDKSGSVTPEEAVRVPGLAARFTQLDENVDSALSEEEYKALAEEGKPYAPTLPR